MRDFLYRIRAGEIIVADGAMGTMCFEAGLRVGDCPELLNIENPQLIEDITRSYLEAGSQIVQTNTFGGTALKLAPYGLQKRSAEINEAAVKIARRAAGDRAYISGSCGPSGKILQPYGDTEPEIIYASFREQINALIEAGADIITVETMVDLEEAKLAIKAARQISSTIPVMAAMTFDSTPNGFFTIMGISIEDAAVGLKEAGADIIGSNCGNGIRDMVMIASGFRQATDMPLIIQSNAGLPKVENGKTVYTETPEMMAEHAKDLMVLPVSVIGGCCGTTPEHIRALRKMVDSWAA
ncbi:MAG TPA: 5-methyltetrahydrofolate--homocysteine methyltransferase [candidate division Zixibacteria bacterium]|nr:5-methyltetrahydrofolate--homocysteine methyltransferase [candidate division Zixibacteria bacterium]HEQ99889.1 5-methyltetrahydrofolate--homocysteine methyltransferase [candidate division Zixibacteria bacterium]